METAIPELDAIKRQLMGLHRPKKPKMLVVDDEPDNLDLLYRTFRRDFSVLKADSGVRALELLATEGEVAVIISDQRMPEMKGTEFLSKTLPQFPNTVRIILTGFTDIEDLVDAINSGQVYKYITKPWDPNELKAVVQRAAETYELLNQRTEELYRAQVQTRLFANIMQVAQEAEDLQKALTAIAMALGDNFLADVCIVQLVKDGTLALTYGVHTPGDPVENWLAQDPLTQTAITSKTIQASVNVPTDAELATLDHYQTSGIQAHLSIPALYRGEVLAIISLQWKQPCKLRPDELTTVYLCAEQIALVVTALHR